MYIFADKSLSIPKNLNIFEDNNFSMAWVNISDDWIENSLFSIKGNQFPIEEAFKLELPFSPQVLMENQQTSKLLQSLFISKYHYEAIIPPMPQMKLLPQVFFWRINGYSSFCAFNSKLIKQFKSIFQKANYNMLDNLEELPTTLKVFFVPYHPYLREYWTQIKRINNNDSRYIFKLYLNETPKPYSIVENAQVISGFIDIEADKVQFNTFEKPPKNILLAISTLLKRKIVLEAMEEGYTYDVIILNKAVNVRGKMGQKSRIVVKSMIPNEIIKSTLKLLREASVEQSSVPQTSIAMS